MTQPMILKDFETNDGNCIYCNSQNDLILELRVEAIKWIKELTREYKSLQKESEKRLNLIRKEIIIPPGNFYKDDVISSNHFLITQIGLSTFLI